MSALPCSICKNAIAPIKHITHSILWSDLHACDVCLAKATAEAQAWRSQWVDDYPVTGDDVHNWIGWKVKYPTTPFPTPEQIEAGDYPGAEPNAAT
jgi:hypothetical protein